MQLLSWIFSFFLTTLPTIYGQQYEGDACYVRRSEGVCTRLRECPEVLGKLLTGERPEQSCGFFGFEPIICCPKRPSMPTTTERPPSKPTPSTRRTTTKKKTTKRPTTKRPTTKKPTTKRPTTKRPTTKKKTTKRPTTKKPTTKRPTTERKTTKPTTPKTTNPFLVGSTAKPTTTKRPTPKTMKPIVLGPTTVSPTTKKAPIIDARVGSKSKAKCAEYAPAIKPASCVFKFKKLVVGGNVTRSKEFPHMAAIGYRGDQQEVNWLCGGTLLSENYVLTAAHCLNSPSWGAPIRVRVGDLNLVKTDDDAKPQERDVAQLIMHPMYKPPAVYHDIGLIKLDKPVVLDDYVQPACLPYDKELVAYYPVAKATGWGLVEWGEDKGSDDLMGVSLSIVKQADCNKSYSDGQDPSLELGVVEDWQICAGSFGKDTCQGDSGGPLSLYDIDEGSCVHTVIGVTSVGRLCGNIVPGIYTRVANYIQWLENIIWP